MAVQLSGKLSIFMIWSNWPIEMDSKLTESIVYILIIVFIALWLEKTNSKHLIDHKIQILE